MTNDLSAGGTARVKHFFVTHIGEVSVNDLSTVIFEANSQCPVGLTVKVGHPAKVIVHADTIFEIAKGIKEAQRAFRREAKP